MQPDESGPDERVVGESAVGESAFGSRWGRMIAVDPWRENNVRFVGANYAVSDGRNGEVVFFLD
jgi:hypothetical protein